MPSEAQDPRDRGLTPPVTRAGRSAQLAKAAATSLNVSERRPRGRPRKDGSSNTPAPPLQPPPAPPAAPASCPKSRKKGRGRVRVQQEDEERVDAAQQKPQETEVKEKTAGGRSSRRKSTNPEPSQDRPKPGPELDPGPSQDRPKPEPELDPEPNQDRPKPEPELDPGPSQDHPKPEPELDPGPSQDRPKPEAELDPGPSQDRPKPEAELEAKPSQDDLKPQPDPAPSEDHSKPEPELDPEPSLDHSKPEPELDPEPSEDHPKAEPELDPGPSQDHQETGNEMDSDPSHAHLKPQPEPDLVPSEDHSKPEPELDPEPTQDHPKAEPDPAPSQDHPEAEPEVDPTPSQDHPKSERDLDSGPSQDDPKPEPEPDSAPSQDHPKAEPEVDPTPSQDHPKSEHELDPGPSQDDPKPEPELDPGPSQDHPKAEPDLDPEPSQEDVKTEFEVDPGPSQDHPKPEPEVDPTPSQDHPKSEHDLDPGPSQDDPKPEPEPDSAPSQDHPEAEPEVDPTHSQDHPKSEHELDPGPSQDDPKPEPELDPGPSQDHPKAEPDLDPEPSQEDVKTEFEVDPGPSQDHPKPEPELDPEPSQEDVKTEFEVDPGPSQDDPNPELTLFQVSFISGPEPSQGGLISQSDQDLKEPWLECEHNKDHLGRPSEPAEDHIHPEPEGNPGTSLSPNQEPSKDHSNPKLQTDPESGPNHLSPKPEPSPDHLSEESGFPEPSSDPAASAVEIGESGAAHTLFLVFTSAETAPSSPQPCSLDLSCNPVSMVIDCDKAAEREGGGSSSTEQSPTFSPLASPCPRLDDEDPLSPLFHQNVSEDSGSSGPPILVHSKKFLKQCAFCYRGDNQAPLGQGHLMVFGPTPGYIPLHILNRRASSDCDNDCHDYCYGGSQTPSTCSSPEQCESSSEFVEQLGPVGLPHDLNIQSLFDPTGQCCAHQQCAAWSEGVCCGEGQSLLYVDKAIDSGSTQVCAYCQRLGASLRCCKANCGRSYHFPCAAAAGAQQNWAERHLLCTKHAVAVTLPCKGCLSGGDAGSLLMCCCCGDCYHGDCLDPPVVPTPLCRAGWQCPQCRVCQGCRSRGIEGTLLVCERCDKAYHTHCLTPPLDHRPSTGWSCKNCRICRRCGVRSSGQWANHPFLCKPCDPALPCPVCDSSPEPYKPQETLTCICCFRCVHTDCASGWQREGRVGPEDYICSTCRPKEGELVPNRPTQPPSFFISLPTDPDGKDTISLHIPAQFISSEPSQEPVKPECTPLPAEPQCSPSLQQNTTDPHIHPAPCRAESTEVQHSSAVPTSPAQQSPQPESESKDIHYFQEPPHQEALVQQHCSLASPRNARELHSTPPPSQHSPSEQLDRPATPQPYNSEPNLAASRQDPVEPRHPSPSESCYCPAAPQRDPEEPHHCPPPSQPGQSTPHSDSEPPQPESKEPQQSPAAPKEDLIEFHHSPSHHPETQSATDSRSPFHQDPVEPGSDHAPSHAELTEKCLEPPDQDPAQLHHHPESVERTPATHQSEHSVLLYSPALLCFTTTEIQNSPSQTQADPPDFHRSPTSQLPPTDLPHSPEPKELVGNVAQLHGDPTEAPPSPAPTLAKNLDSPQGLSSHFEPAKLHVTAVSSHANTEKRTDSTNQENHLGTNSSPTEHPEDPSLAPICIIGPARMHQSSANLNEIQNSSDQLGHHSATSTISSSPEDQCTATTFPHSPEQESLMLCSDAPSPSQMQLQPGLSNIQQTPPPDTPCQQSLPLLRPAQDCVSELTPHPAEDPEPPLAQEGSESTSQVLLPRRDAHTIFKSDRDCSPVYCRSPRTVIKQASPKSLSAPCSPSPSQPPIKCSVSQPSSPVPSQFKLGSSQFVVQSEVTFKCDNKSEVLSLDCFPIQMGPAVKRQTLEKSQDSLSPVSNVSPMATSDTDDKLSKSLTPAISGRLDTDHLSLASVPSKPTLQSLSPHPSEAMVPLPPQRPCDSFLCCTEPNDMLETRSVSHSPQHTSQMPTISAASLPACPLTGEPSPATDEASCQPSNLFESPVRSPESSHAVTPPPTYLNLFQSNKNEGEAQLPHPSVEPETGDLCSSADSLDHDSIVHNAATINDGLRDSVHDQEKILFTVCGSAEVTQTNVSPPRSAQLSVPNPDSPSQTTTLTSCGPLPCKRTVSHDDQATFSPAKRTETHSSHFPDRSCHVGPGNPVNVDTPSVNSPSGASASTTPSSLAQTTAEFVSSPHSLAQSNKLCCSPQHNPVLNTENKPGPSSSLKVDIDVSSKMLNSFLPSLVSFESGPEKPDNVGEMMPEPVSSSLYNKSTVVSHSPDAAHHTLNPCVTDSQQSPGSTSPLPLRAASSADISSSLASPSPQSPVCCSPSQVSSSMRSCSHITGAPVCPQALSPHRVTSSPATNPKCGSLQSSNRQVHPSPVSGHSEDTPSPGPDSPLLCFHATLTSVPQNIQTQRESAAAEYPNLAEEVMASEKIIEENEKREDPPQEKLPEESGEGKDPRGEWHPEEKQSSFSCSTGVQQEVPTDAPVSPLPAQPAPHSPDLINLQSASPPNQPTVPSPADLLSPCHLHGANSLDSCTSSPHRNSSSSCCSPHAPPIPSPVDLHSKEEQLSNRQPLEEASGETLMLNNQSVSYKVTLDGDDGQSERQATPVPVETEPTTDESQSHSRPLERRKEGSATPEPASSHTSEEVPGARNWMEEEEELQDKSEAEEEEIPMSPVPELDPSLDDVMEVMTSESPPLTLRNPSSPSPVFFYGRGKEQGLAGPPCSSMPSDDLSIRLRLSPFSTEASPETSPTRVPITPPPLSPASPHLHSSPDKNFVPLSKAPPTLLLPFTPKIGMGKPAISKRKFSPARARIKQGSCWSNRRAVSPPSSSQDSMGESGWDSPKPRPQDPPLWSMRVGRGSGFPGRRRSRGGGVGGGRGARGRSRLKAQDSLTVLPGSVSMEAFQPKEEEENSMHNTVVMFSTSDHFTLKQDMCVVCGSFGQGAEGRLLACSQCGQCYHPFCVNVKMTRVVLTKGWRCLECTVCEACGEASDPGRLLLCDDCDISYHTYCLDPPLHTVPKGAWKCKWCVKCIQCGSSSPGVRCDWQDNYSRCGPCGSLRCCPLCQKQYMHNELIMQCQQCDRWVHATCQGLSCEDEVEAVADEGFDCSLCRGHGCSSYGKCDSFSSPHMVQMSSRLREPGVESKTFTQDGVRLTESGLAHLQSLVEPLMSPRRYRRGKPKLKLRIINQNSVSVLTPAEPDTPTEQDLRGGLDCELKSDSSPEREHSHNYDIAGEPEGADGNKKRKRKPYRPGIGGFMVRQRGGKMGLSRIKLCRRDSSELLCRDEDVSVETTLNIDHTPGKVKKRYRKKKTKLEEVFPSYLQEAFFGKDLLDQSRQGGRRLGPGTLVQPIRSTNQLVTTADEKRRPNPTTGADGSKNQGTLPISNGTLLDLSEVLITDPHILATGHTGHFQVERSPSPFAGLDLASMTDDPSFTGSGGCGQRMAQEEPLDAILSPELDKMVTDGAILGKLYKIPELEGKDVEEVFTAVLRPNNSNSQLEQRQNTNTAAGNHTHTQQTAVAFPRLPLMNGRMGAVPHFTNPAVMSSSAQGPAGFRLGSAEGHVPGPGSDHSHGQPLTNQGSAGEGEQDAMSTAQKSMLKWEKEEALGEMATVAPVLYCNTNFPQLREQYPEWSTRVKQIAKLWRKACSQDRAPFVQKARDNRAAQRINKVQFSNEPVKHQQATQPPLPVPYDPACVEVEGGFRDPLKSKESEQEQEWKLRQGEVNDRWEASKKRQEYLPQSKALKSTDKDCPFQASVAGGGKEALQMRQKSKQQAKMEATQKLEQVKNEQRQQLAAQRLSRPVSPDNSSRSPMTPVMLGSASPNHTPPSSRENQFRHHLLLQGSSGQADDVFLKPQAPPPSGYSLPHSPHPSSPLHQPPSSPQMFSPPSSRPSSPWDTLKGGGTSRSISCQPGNLPGSQQQRRNSLSPSPGHDMFGSPAPSPDSKTPIDASRNLISQSGLQQSRGGLISSPSGSGSELLSHHATLRPTESFQRSQNSGTLRHSLDPSFRAGDPVQLNLFKAPMRPQQEVCSGAGGGGRRDPSRPADGNFAGLSQSQDSAFPSSPLSALGSPQQSPYAQMPGTPRPEYNQQTADPFIQQSPPYINPQTTGTPRPHSDPAYMVTPPALRLEQYNQQQPAAAHRPSPSHQSTDPYASNPGTPRPSVVERFPRSPGSQRSGDTSSGGTPRPDQYSQQSPTVRTQKPSVDGSTPQHGGPGSSPLALQNFTSTQHQLSPGQHHLLDSFPRNPISQTQKHSGSLEASGFSGLGGQPTPNPFEQGPVVPGSSHTDKTKSNELDQLDVASLTGSVNMLPQQGESEEKLRQRQRLRQLILRQQQQKNVSRQEKVLQDGAAGPPHHWLQKESTSASPANPFGRPPPPYPGSIRPPGTMALRCPGNFTAEQPRNSTEAPGLRQNLPGEQGVQGLVQRIAAPPGGLQGSFLRMSPGAGAGPAPGLVAQHGGSVQIKRPGEFAGIRPVTATAGHMMPGACQPFLPRALPLQQHSIMGQPYIELRHRAPENRLRLPFPSSAELQARNVQAPPLGQQLVMQQHVGSSVTSQNSESALPGAEGIEDHLEGEDSAVKDLEDVEVKDLVDLNLNLDPEDGKEDLDLGPNDLHLDDFLLSGKFDLIAYADPELNLEEKKDMFNEELDLGEVAAEEKEGGARKADHLVKQEMQDYTAEAQREGVNSCQMPCQSAPSIVLRKVEDSASGTGAVPVFHTQGSADPLGISSQVHPPSAEGQAKSGVQQRSYSSPSSAQSSIFTSSTQGPLISPHTSVTPQVMPLPPPQPHLPLSSQTQTPHMGTSTQVQTPNPTMFTEQQIQEHKQRPLLLEEQPLLLQDLLDQERQEQQQQKQMQALIRHRSTPDPVVTNMAEFDSISDPIMKAKMVALKGINKVMIQGNLGMNPMVINRLQQDPVAQGALVKPVSEGTPQLVAQDEKVTPQLVRPNPPNFGSNFVNESQRRQYEEWLAETQQLLQMQQRLLEDQITTHRKTKKSLSAKQRTARKAGRAFAEEDAAQLRHVTELQGTVQKQLEQIRKQQKNHTELIEDYRTKQQQQQQQQQQQAALQQPPTASQKLSQPVGGPAPSHTPIITASWASGGGTPGVFAQKVPPMALPDAPQPPSHRQAPGFTTGTQGPTGGSGERPPPCQVNYDDNNPFSEGFQERERRERLKEQQERQRVQLLQEVELHRALEQRMEMEQEALFGPPGGLAVAASAGGPGGPATGPTPGPTPGPASENLSQMPFFSSELPQDFLQTCPVSRPQQNQSQTDFQHADAHQSFCEDAPNPEALLAPGLRPRTAEHGMAQLESRSSPRFLSTAGLPDPVEPTAVPLSHLERKAYQFGRDFSSSSPSSPLPCLSGEPTTLLKKKNRDVDDTGAGTPLSSHSDDITVPSTPAVLDSSYSGSAQALPSVTLPQVKKEHEDRGACEGGRVKKEAEAEEVCGRSKDGDGSKELLRQLLKEKTSHITTLPTSHTPLATHRQSSNESVHSEEDDRPGLHGNIDNIQDLLDSRNKLQHCKRPSRPEKDRLPPKNKRRKREDEEIMLCSSSSEPIFTHLSQLSVLPLMEPVLGVDLSVFPPYGSSCLGRNSRLSGSFGNTSLEGVTDFYSQLIYKNNLSNPPTPPASLPPTPPPAARQKLMNGFATTDELSTKDGLTQKGERLVPLNPTNKTVDVPASLPTPPHNIQEELKVQVSSECETPDSYVPSSSPESVADMEVSRFPDLSFIKLEPLSPCPSPTLPALPSARGKASAVKQEVKVEPNPQDHPSCSNTDLVTIAITLNPVAAQNIGGVVAAVAQLLRVSVPGDYQLSRSTVADHGSLALLAGVCMPLTRSSIDGRQQRPSTAAGDVQHGNFAAKPQCCSYCKGMLGKGVQLRELKQEGQSRPGTSLVFCSPNCSSLYSSDLRRAAGTKAVELTTVMSSKQAPPSRVQHKYTNNMSSIAVHSLLHTPSPLPNTHSPPPHFPSASTITMETKTHMDSLKVTVKLKPHPRAVPGGDDMPFPHPKKMKSLRWRRWNISISSSSRSFTIPSEALGMPSEEEVDLLLRKFGMFLHSDPLPRDQRRCCFCNQQGDGQTDGPARLLNLDLDLWVHLNCALWSSEVYETQAGALINVELALRRGLTLRCAHCQQVGATIGCNRFRCTNTYHFKCALQASCTFFKDKTMLCQLHKPRTVSLSGEKSSSCSPSSNLGSVCDHSIIVTSDPYDSELRCFTVFRRVFVQRDEARQIAALVQRSERQHTFRVGSLLFRSVGRLLPQQMSMFHNNSAIFPIGYHANRIYWSMRHSNRRCKYMCYIEEKENQPLFKVKVVEKGQDDVILTGPTPKAVWDQILAPISQMRSTSGTLKLFPVYLKGEDLFGLTTSAVTRIIESLPGVENCERYTFRFGRNPLMEWPLAFNPSGSARSEPKAYQNKRPNLLTSIAPRCQGTVGSIVGLVPGVISLSPGESVAGAHQGRHSKSSQYRRMKAEWKSNVYLARSRIQGLGLYAARDIEKCTMVIEYIGTIIRSEVANRKERLYESQNRGVYMFRIDNDFVIDATITGGPARYINHSCSPNCITEVVSVEKENKIIISSCRRIQRGEELSYDYKFDLEDDQHKIPCHCGAVNCRKWMN